MQARTLAGARTLSQDARAFALPRPLSPPAPPRPPPRPPPLLFPPGTLDAGVCARTRARARVLVCVQEQTPLSPRPRRVHTRQDAQLARARERAILEFSARIRTLCPNLTGSCRGGWPCRALPRADAAAPESAAPPPPNHGPAAATATTATNTAHAAAAARAPSPPTRPLPSLAQARRRSRWRFRDSRLAPCLAAAPLPGGVGGWGGGLDVRSGGGGGLRVRGRALSAWASPWLCVEEGGEKWAGGGWRRHQRRRGEGESEGDGGRGEGKGRERAGGREG